MEDQDVPQVEVVVQEECDILILIQLQVVFQFQQVQDHILLP